MKKKFFIFSDYKKNKVNISSEDILNKKNIIYFNSINFKKNKYYKRKIKKKDSIIFIIKDEKHKSTSDKILLLSLILEMIKGLRIKNKILIFNMIAKYKNKNDKFLQKLEKKIFSEMIEAYNNMFSLSFFFYNKMNNKKKINFVDLIKNKKIN